MDNSVEIFVQCPYCEEHYTVNAIECKHKLYSYETVEDESYEDFTYHMERCQRISLSNNSIN